jgi:hypothetical protein
VTIATPGPETFWGLRAVDLDVAELLMVVALFLYV